MWTATYGLWVVTANRCWSSNGYEPSHGLVVGSPLMQKTFSFLLF